MSYLRLSRTKLLIKSFEFTIQRLLRASVTIFGVAVAVRAMIGTYKRIDNDRGIETYRRIGELLSQLSQFRVIRPEVVAPLGHAVSLVDHEPSQKTTFVQIKKHRIETSRCTDLDLKTCALAGNFDSPFLGLHTITLSALDPGVVVYKCPLEHPMKGRRSKLHKESVANCWSSKHNVFLRISKTTHTQFFHLRFLIFNQGS